MIGRFARSMYGCESVLLYRKLVYEESQDLMGRDFWQGGALSWTIHEMSFDFDAVKDEIINISRMWDKENNPNPRREHKTSRTPWARSIH